MNFGQTVILGAIAGFTIYLGLPIGRVQRVSNNARGFLTMTSVGILVFLLFDIFGHIKDPIERALAESVEGKTPYSDGERPRGWAVSVRLRSRARPGDSLA